MIRSAYAVAIALLLLATRAASAATPDAVVAARDAFDEGRAAMKAEDVSRACPKLEEAERLDPNVGYAVNLARCEEKRGALVKAREKWQEALDLARVRQDERTAEVEAGLRAIDTQVPRVIVTKAQPLEPALVVHIDDIAIDRLNLASPLPVDPGAHRIVATAPGYRGWSTTLTIARGSGETTVAIPALEVGVDPLVAAEPPRVTGPPATRGTTQRTVGIVALGFGAVGLGISAGFALHAHARDADSTAECGVNGDKNACSARGVELRSSARSAAGIATGAFVAGGIVAVGGLVLWLTAPKNSARAVGISPAPSGVSLQGRF